jgi:DNA-binding transcriptional LysR family regulator
MDLKRLRLLSELPILGTITKVAERHGRTRPAISQQLAMLEEEVGAQLLDRTGRGVRLTATGKRLVHMSAPIFALLESLQSEVNLTKEGDIEAELQLSAFGSAIGALMPETVSILARSHPGLSLRIAEHESRDGLRAVATRQADLAVVHDLAEIGTFADLVECQTLCVDDCVAVLSSQHPLARAGEIDLKDLASDHWAINTASEPYHSLLIKACSEQGFSPDIRASCRNMLATLALVKGGGFVTVLPFFGVCGMQDGAGLAIVKLREPIKRSVRIVLAKGRVICPGIVAVTEALKEAARRLSP